MEKTPRYTQGGTRDPRNPDLDPEEVQKAGEKADSEKPKTAS